MASSFDEQYPDNEWNDFINSNYATGYEDPTLFSSLDYFVNHGTLEPNHRPTIFAQDLQTNQTPGDRISTPTCIDHVNLQGSLGGQDSSVKSGETGPEYKEIKALIEENSRYLVKAVRRSMENINICERQINLLSQHVEALHPYFEAMRSTLKDLTEQVNRQWVVKTPITPLPKRQNGPSQGGNSGNANKGEVSSGERRGG